MAFSSLHIGATGLIAHGESMQVIGNNLANVSTVGFKGSDTIFGALMSQSVAEGCNRMPSGAMVMSQKGMGVSVTAIQKHFLQGGFETTREATDLAIGGNGFFGVRDSESGDMFYTRAGVFRFDQDAYLRDPNGLVLQGYQVDRETGEVQAAATDIQLPYEDVVVDGEITRVVMSPPRATSEVMLTTNLDYEAQDHYTSSTDPFFALLAAYDGTSSPPLGDSFLGYQTDMTVYDDQGGSHNLTLYFDRVGESSLSNAGGGFHYWEFLVGIDPGEDAGTNMGTSAAGLLAAGTMSFDHYGTFRGMSLYTPGTGSAAGGGVKDLGGWGLSGFSEDGFPTVDVAFGSSGAGAGAGAAGQTISLNFGLSSESGSWVGGAGTASNVGQNVLNLATMGSMARDAYATTSYDSGSATFIRNQDGYTSGYLQGVSVDEDGFLTGTFSNNRTEQFYQVNLYRFASEYGLRSEGGNIYSATDASGDALVGVAEEGGRGNISQNTLEMSNVDMAEQFADLILTQRGFQSNTKVITTSDSLLNTAINIKR